MNYHKPFKDRTRSLVRDAGCVVERQLNAGTGCCVAVPSSRVLLTSVTRGCERKGKGRRRQMRARAHAAGAEPKKDYCARFARREGLRKKNKIKLGIQERRKKE